MLDIIDRPMSANRALWEKGDFTRIAESMRRSGEQFVEELGPVAGLDVLDLGCGDGTTALPLAERGARVTGIDIAANLVAAGNRRAARAGLDNLRFQQGDACDLSGVADESFDLVVSVFGAMFAPRPFDVAREMLRVTHSGGRIVMGNWIPGDPTLVAQILKTSAAYAPAPPSGFVSPMLWGDEEQAKARFAVYGVRPDRIRFERSAWFFRHPGRPRELLSIFRDFYGPTMNAFEAAAKAGTAADLERELAQLFETQNRAPDSTEIPATYLKVTVCKP